MSYNRRYFLQRVKEINETFLAASQKGLSTEYIYRTIILPRYHISRTTLYNYLCIPYARLLREINEKKTRVEAGEQLVIFNEKQDETD